MFFTVTRDIKIGGKVYKPCISYPLRPELTATVNSLVLQGRALIREEELRFANGSPVYPKKKVQKEQPVKTAVKKTTKKKGK